MTGLKNWGQCLTYKNLIDSRLNVGNVAVMLLCKNVSIKVYETIILLRGLCG